MKKLANRNCPLRKREEQFRKSLLLFFFLSPFQHTKHALPDSDATRMDQKLRRRRVCEKLALVPGKLDHATVVAFSVANRKKSLQAYSGKIKFQYSGAKLRINKAHFI